MKGFVLDKMIPRNIQEWTLDSIRSILDQGVHENESFDFKVELPRKRAKAERNPEKVVNQEDSEADNLRLELCAFANSGGGFLIYGVDPSTEKSTEERLVGIDRNCDFGEMFGKFPMACTPSVPWNWRVPPIYLNDSHVIHVIEIMSGDFTQPHVTGKDGNYYFRKRTNTGKEPMSYQEIKNMFIGKEDRIGKLLHLQSELNYIAASCDTILNALRDPNGSPKGSVLTMLRFDTHSLAELSNLNWWAIQKDKTLETSIFSIRTQTRIANEYMKRIHSFELMSYSEMDKMNFIAEHNRQIMSRCTAILLLIETSSHAINSLLID